MLGGGTEKRKGVWGREEGDRRGMGGLMLPLGLWRAMYDMRR